MKMKVPPASSANAAAILAGGLLFSGPAAAEVLFREPLMSGMANREGSVNPLSSTRGVQREPEGADLLDERDLPELQRARQLWSRSRWDEAEAAFLQIVSKHPNNLHALVDASRVLGDRRQVRRAQGLLNRLTLLADTLSAAEP